MANLKANNKTKTNGYINLTLSKSHYHHDEIVNGEINLHLDSETQPLRVLLICLGKERSSYPEILAP